MVRGLCHSGSATATLSPRSHTAHDCKARRHENREQRDDEELRFGHRKPTASPSGAPNADLVVFTHHPSKSVEQQVAVVELIRSSWSQSRRRRSPQRVHRLGNELERPRRLMALPAPHPTPGASRRQRPTLRIRLCRARWPPSSRLAARTRRADADDRWIGDFGHRHYGTGPIRSLPGVTSGAWS